MCYVMRFEEKETGGVDCLYRTHDSEVPNGEEYVKGRYCDYMGG